MNDDARRPGKTLVWVPCTWPHPQDLDSQLHRRRDTAARSVPLGCGCRDPYVCRCNRAAPSQRWVDAGAAAAAHLLDLGYTPSLEVEVLRALWRRGGPDRNLAQQCYDLAGG